MCVIWNECASIKTASNQFAPFTRHRTQPINVSAGAATKGVAGQGATRAVTTVIRARPTPYLCVQKQLQQVGTGLWWVKWEGGAREGDALCVRGHIPHDKLAIKSKRSV